MVGIRSITGIRWLNSDCRKKYSINFTESRKKFCLSMHYNGASSYLFVNDVEIHKFKAKTLKFTIHLLKCIVKDFKSSFNSAFSLCFCFDLLQNLPNFSGSIYIRHLPSVSNLGFLCRGRKFINLLYFDF